MAEALVSVLVERLVTITAGKISGEFKLVTGVEIEVENLTHNLEAILAVLEDAEQRQVTDSSVRHWLDQLKEVSYEMDNVLDEWITQVRKRQMEKAEKHAVAIAKKVRSCASSFFSGSKVKRLIHRGDIAGRIKKLNERLALIDKEKQRFNFQNNTIRGREIPRQETTCFSTGKIFGRENEKSIILSKLLSESSQDCEVPLIIPIVGMGGMGKTTLCQLAYNDEKVKTHFNKRIWVCVSDPFDEIKIARAIVEGLDNDNTSKFSNSLQILMQHIHTLIQGKQILLVLDDVWNPIRTQWEELIKPFCHGAVGSRVLVTTRNEEVATLMKATTHVIHMKKLSEEFCSSLFYYNAGIDIGSSESEKFQDVGGKIVKKCDGLPLAANTIGSLMREKSTLKEWEDILNSKLWELEDIEEQVFRPLLLSYYDLTPQIRNCLLYCVIFQKNYVYDRENLVELWMSQNYLNVEGMSQNYLKVEESKEMRKYFDKLVMRSFFQEVEVDEYENITCKIHDIIHDFILYMTKKECLIVNVGPSFPKRENEKVRHLTLANSQSWDNFRSYENLRTLVVLNGHCFSRREILLLKYVRTLSCFKTGIKGIPKEISGLIHLRYLDLSGNWELEELPDTLGSLYNLQTLRLVCCVFLKKVDLGRLINLRHLSVRGCENLKLRGIERLRDLQTLDEFYVQDGDEGNKLEHLKNLNQLQGRLTITILGGPLAGEGYAAIMVNMEHLLHVFLNVRGDVQWDLTALQPPPRLQSLTIHNYRSQPLSADWWSSLHSLRLLTLSECNFLPSLGNLASLESLNIHRFRGISLSTNWRSSSHSLKRLTLSGCEDLPSLGNLACLESLYIEEVDLRKVGVEFLGIHDHDRSETSWRRQTSFPKLKQLTFHDMRDWKEWEGVKEDSEKMVIIMPCLSELTISRCPELEALPKFLWKTRLQKLHISKSPILQKLYRQGTGEQWANISHIPNIDVEIQQEEPLRMNVYRTFNNISSIGASCLAAESS